MRAGFSYAEFLIVITLIVLASAGGTLAVIGFYNTQAPRAALKIIAAHMGDARNRSIVQENGAYWGVKAEDMSPRDRYALFSAADAALAGYAEAAAGYIGRGVNLALPANPTVVMFDKLNGSRVLPVCAGGAPITITAGSSALTVHCNGRIDVQ
jgi:hypothetical protein